MPIRPRPEVEGLQACAHGGPVQAELEALGLKPEDIVDFSVSSNPFSYPPAVKMALGSVVIDRYPDSESTELRRCLADELSVQPENIVVGSGSMEVIRLITTAYLGRGNKALILKPTFGEYEVACRIAGADISELWAAESDSYAFDTDKTVAAIKRGRPRVVFLCNPNNPTGSYLSQQQIEMMLEALGKGLLILDEAYIAFTEGEWPSTGIVRRDNLICLRSMTKDYALAGLRLGYAISSIEIIDNLCRVRPPWNVSDAAQKAGVAALGDSGYLKRCETKIRRARQYLMAELSTMDYNVLPSKTNFFLVKVGDGRRFRAALLKRGLMLRDCASFGLPQYVRIAARTMDECRRLIAVIKELMGRGELDVSG
ncbi:MAG: histidinol-phosphate transaminase [Dehalococcoidales bacterium]